MSSVGIAWKSIEMITKQERQELSNLYTGQNTGKIGGDNAASTGITAAILAHHCGAESVTLSGISLHGGHSYIQGDTPRGHMKIDSLLMSKLNFPHYFLGKYDEYI